jgi:hypothetical protein
VIPSDELMAAFSSSGLWQNIHYGDLAFACDGEATIDLGAALYSWRKLASRLSEINKEHRLIYYFLHREQDRRAGIDIVD